MELKRQGYTRAQIRQGGGRGHGDDHVDELLGVSELYIYVTPNRQAKGYEALKVYLEAQGCEVVMGADAPLQPGSRYEAVAITNKDELIPDSAVRRAHRWAHSRNFLHSFFKPMFQLPKTGA